MDLEECARCGEEYPTNWVGCPYCDSGEKPHFRLGEDDFWN